MNETVLGFGKRHERVPAISRFPDAAIAKPNQSMVSIRWVNRNGSDPLLMPAGLISVQTCRRPVEPANRSTIATPSAVIPAKATAKPILPLRRCIICGAVLSMLERNHQRSWRVRIDRRRG